MQNQLASEQELQPRSNRSAMNRQISVLFFALSVVVLHSTDAVSQDHPSQVRVAAISFEPTKLDLAGNCDRLEFHFREAAKGGAKIAVAPEGILEGYIVNEILADEYKPAQMHDVAVELNSPTIQRFQRLARELQICVVFGFAEKIGKEVYNSAVFIDDVGKICGTYHKMQLHEGYDPEWWFNRLGRQSRAFETPYGKCGILICNDRWNPLLAKIPALDGAQFLIIPSFGSTSKAQDEAVLSRGVENNLPVIEANVGVSLIVSDNQIVAVDRHREGITYGEINIPAPRPKDTVNRDRTEVEFLRWRETEMPQRLAKTVANYDPHGPAREQDVTQLKSSRLKVTLGNNRSAEINGEQHRAGYNGIFAITSPDQPESPFVPAYSGWNLEHYFDASPRSAANIFFEPRYAAMKLKRSDNRTVELYQSATPAYQVESWTRFRASDPYYLDFSYRCKPHRDDYAGDFLGVFWASYMNGPIDKSIYFLDGESSLTQPTWRQLCTQQHNRDSTVKQNQDSTELKFETGDTLFSNISPMTYSAPFFYGRFRNMVLIYVFRENQNLRFAHSPSGGGRNSAGNDTNPAWDFQLIIPNTQKGQEYQLEGRLIYKPWKGRADVLAEVSRYLQGVKESDNQ